MIKLANIANRIAGRTASAQSPERLGRRIARCIEAVLLVAGLASIGFFAAARLESCFGASAALKTFESTKAMTEAGLGAGEETLSIESPNFDGWDKGRIRAYREAAIDRRGAPLAVIRIPAIRLVAPLMEGTDEITLNHAVGRIAGTAMPGSAGNIGIAGHRDGFFRGLKDIKRGDRIELETSSARYVYAVSRTQVVRPDDVSVLEPQAGSAVTLITCYPFYFIGSAPKRFVVTAFLEDRQPPTRHNL